MAKKSDEQQSQEVLQSRDAVNRNIVELEKGESGGTLLSPQERDVCLRISEGDTIHSQRAGALLAIDDGATQAQAGQRAGLTQGQVSYWLGKFRKVRLDIFPQDYLKGVEAAQVISQSETPVEDAHLVESSEVAKPSKKVKKSKQAKKSPGKKSKDKKGKRTTKKKRGKPKGEKGIDKVKKKKKKKKKKVNESK